MMPIQRALAVGVAATAATLACGGPASAQIRWRTGLSRLSGKTYAQVLDAVAGIGQRRGGRHIVIQFDGPITAQHRTALKAAGVTLLSCLGDHAFFASVAPGGADHAALAKVQPILDASAIELRWKLHPVLQRGETPTWAVVPVPESKLAEPGAADKTWIGHTSCFIRTFPQRRRCGFWHRTAWWSAPD